MPVAQAIANHLRHNLPALTTPDNIPVFTIGDARKDVPNDRIEVDTTDNIPHVPGLGAVIRETVRIVLTLNISSPAAPRRTQIWNSLAGILYDPGLPSALEGEVRTLTVQSGDAGTTSDGYMYEFELEALEVVNSPIP